MMPVHDEVDVAHLVEHHRGQAYVLVKGPVHPLPAVGERVAGRKKRLVEVAVAIDAADNLGHLDGPDSPVDGAADVEPLLDLVVGQERIALAGEQGPEIAQEGLGPRAREVLVDAGIDVAGSLNSQCRSPDTDTR
jgi:hypothetical protein